MSEALLNPSPKAKVQKSNPKLKIWTCEIGCAFKELRSAVNLWAETGKPRDLQNNLFEKMNKSKRHFRSSIRREHARRLTQDRENIMNAHIGDKKTLL